MEASPRRLWLVVVLSAWCVRRDAADQAAQMVHQLVKDSLAGCHVVLVVTTPQSPLLSFVDGQSTQSFVLMSSSMEQRYVLRALAGDIATTCRGLVMHFDTTTTTTTNNNSSRILGLLELGALWKMPEMRVVVVGGGEGVEDVLLHHSLRNSVHGLYLAPQPRRRHYSQVNASLSRQRLTPHHSRDSSCEGGDERVSVYRRCLYCKAGQEGVQHLGQWQASDGRLNELFFDKDEQFKSLNGHRFKIVSIPYIPYIDFRRDKDEPGTTVTPTFSIEAYILKEFTERLNFTYVMREQPDGVWGRRVNGSFIGMMGQLERQEVDYCTLCGFTYNRNKIIDHLHNYPSDPITVVSLKPSLLPQHLLLVRPLTG